MMKTFVMVRETSKIILLVAFIMNYTLLKAQTNEFSVHAAGGFSTFGYDLLQGKKTDGFGGNLGLGYTYLFNSTWGLGTGLEIGYYNTRLKLDATTSIIPDLTNDYGYGYYLQTTLNEYTEKQSAIFLNIPLMLQFQTPLSLGKFFYLRAGGKIGIPFSAKATIHDGSLTNTAIYPDLGMAISEPKFMGLGTFDDRYATETLGFKLAYSAAVEAGVKWLLKNRAALYTGFYFDYGLNDIRKDKDKTFIRQNALDPENFATNSALIAKDFMDKVAPLSTGIRLRLTFGQRQRNKYRYDDGREFHVPTHDLPLISINNQGTNSTSNSTPNRNAVTKPDSISALHYAMAQTAEDRRQQAALITEAQQPVSGFALEAVMTSKMRKQLEAVVTLMKQDPNITILIEGHTCDIGSHAYNVELGRRRAYVTRAFLITQGINPKRISIISKAETEPLVPNTSERNRQKNRRVEIVVIND
ncbi:hypothetical protein FACS1894201_01050 [Bacteroidia bacterium]|nr:hypothetical protein FACS1894201_01050 [Bacteroidia bacterium]